MRRHVKVDSAEVQGEGSYVVMCPLTHGLRRMLERAANLRGDYDEEDQSPEAKAAWQKAEEAVEESVSIALSKCIVEWNWTDGRGDPIPLPESPEQVRDCLTDEERKFVFEAMWQATLPSSEEKKG